VVKSRAKEIKQKAKKMNREGKGMRFVHRKLCLLILLLATQHPALCAYCSAHPVPKGTHDRTIVVRLAADGGRVQVGVDYRLEVDEYTAIFEDLAAQADKADLAKLQKPEEFYEAFTRCYAPILAANLLATLDGQPLEFECVQRWHRLRDEQGTPLNHLRCDFVFQSKPREVPSPADTHALTFKEGNYEYEDGFIRLSLAGAASVHFLSKTEPDAALQAFPATQRKPGDDAKLRNIRATFTTTATSNSKPLLPPSATDKPDVPEESPSWWDLLREGDLRRLFLERRLAFWTLLLLSVAVGGIHALTPGHGKTLVAAYLVGERGTVGHALLLGLVTTLTHTGVVIAVAIGLRLCFPQGSIPDSAKQNVNTALSLGGGLLVVCLGMWLLLRRLSGQADHFHLPGHGHHHHDGHGHSHADHYHDAAGHAHSLSASSQPVGWWGLVVLGVSGGIVPCWDAIYILILAVSMNLLALALPMILAFSAGLAGVLIAIGILVVRAKRLAGSGWENSRVIRALPVISALIVTGIGLWLCYRSVHAKAAPVPVPVQSQPAG
jgi:ABC-type nickel/cobalt efflux system permease component RcnA